MTAGAEAPTSFQGDTGRSTSPPLPSTSQGWLICQSRSGTRAPRRPRSSTCLPAEALVLEADELDQLLVEHQLLVDANGERARIRSLVLDRHVDFHSPVADAP